METIVDFVKENEGKHITLILKTGYVLNLVDYEIKNTGNMPHRELYRLVHGRVIGKNGDGLILEIGDNREGKVEIGYQCIEDYRIGNRVRMKKSK